MRVELKRLHERLQSTAVYVTHDQIEAMTLGDRIVVMNDGRIQQTGKPLEVYSQPQNKFVAGFIGSPAMNFIDASISESNGDLYTEIAGFQIRIPAKRSRHLSSYKGQQVTLGIRPEDFHEFTSARSTDAFVDALVEVVEPLGSEILLDIKVGHQSMVARVNSSFQTRHHEKIRLAFAPERIHFFELQTEDAIM